mgnify:CR=1 FL=1
MLRSWLKLFRVVNLPTVPGDVLVGVAASSFAVDGYVPALVARAAGISVLIYMFGLVDNDLVGAKTDKGRPIADGEISMNAAKIAWFVLFASVPLLAYLSHLPTEWCAPAYLLMTTIMIYNRTKSVIAMGCCRGLNVGCGFAVAVGEAQSVWLLDWRLLVPFAVAGIFTLYIAAVTKYSEGEETDPARKARVGMLIGAHIYLQLIALIVFALLIPSTAPLMVAGAILLVVLRILKHTLPGVSAS